MNAICKQQFKWHGHILLEGEVYQAIYNEKMTQVTLFVRGSKLAALPKEVFREHFKEQRG